MGDGGFLSLALGVAAAPPMLGPFNIAWSILGVKIGVLFARLGLADPGRTRSRLRRRPHRSR